MARVARHHQGATGHNTLVVRRARIFFQKYPGTFGSDAERGIVGAPYTVSVDGVQVASGRTPADGRVDVWLPPGAAVVLRIFDTDYEIQRAGEFDPLDAVNMRAMIIGDSDPKLRAIKQRLDAQGFPFNAIDTTLDDDLDRNILDFQGNATLDTDGLVGPNTRTQLSNTTGAQ